MDQQPQQPQQPQPEVRPEPEIQHGVERSIAKDERLKHVVRQHPQRDEPRVDSVEPWETPAP